jgi:transcriptional pleiotropic repressor
MTLLEKIRTLNKLLQNAAGKPLHFGEMAEVLRETIQADVFVVSRRGKVLGSALSSDFPEMWLRKEDPGELRFSQESNDAFLRIAETAVEVPIAQTLGEVGPAFENRIVTVVPIIGGGDRLGTVVLSAASRTLDEDGLILAECGSTQIGMEILRDRAEERELEARNKAVVSVAIHSLSFSEFEAVEHIFEELEGKEGLLVASKIADRAGITRSVIVNALRKLESAGVIDTRSLGMKGTYIRILNSQLLHEIERQRQGR